MEPTDWDTRGDHRDDEEGFSFCHPFHTPFHTPSLYNDRRIVVEVNVSVSESENILACTRVYTCLRSHHDPSYSAIVVISILNT